MHAQVVLRYITIYTLIYDLYIYLALYTQYTSYVSSEYGARFDFHAGAARSAGFLRFDSVPLRHGAVKPML